MTPDSIVKFVMSKADADKHRPDVNTKPRRCVFCAMPLSAIMHPSAVNDCPVYQCGTTIQAAMHIGSPGSWLIERGALCLADEIQILRAKLDAITPRVVIVTPRTVSPGAQRGYSGVVIEEEGRS